MKEAIKRFLDARVPGLAGPLRNAWRRAHIARFERSQGIPQLARRYIQAKGLHVQSGPFAGMAYVHQAAGSSLVPKLVGSYEAELGPAMREILDDNYSIVVDVGCAEGYYAVGLAMRLPRAIVHAFDIDAKARALCGRLAELNGVADRVKIRSACDHQALQSSLSPRSLVVCDCEGYETHLLDPARVPALADADLLVEFHNHLIPQCESWILERFQATHDVQSFESIARDPNDFPAIVHLNPVEQRLAVNEFRPDRQRWAFLSAKLGRPSHRRDDVADQSLEKRM
jgi:hypothetical protein